ncbi:Ig-like domain-containing protein [Knoellia sp. CPCC 206453]|uniref:Ig-like domain-containing protein n=1 Tax=Knoellia pratensis TaxID=3404796 RepID=UPI00361BEE9A
MRNCRSLQLLALVLLVGMLGLAFPGFSSASFTVRTQTTGSVSAAADWTPPSVAVVSPGSTVKDIPTISVTATDGESAIASVTLEQLPQGGNDWTVVCTDTVAPYACAWDTRSLADGLYSLRARATDAAGYEATSEVVRTTVANKLLVVVTSPGDAVRGTVPLTTTVHNAGTLTHTVRLEYTATGTTSWKAICTGLTSPYACSWNTSGLVAGDFDLRAVLTAGATTTISAVVDAVLVDNINPTVTMLDPGTPLSGNKTFVATASDANSGVVRVVIQSSLNGSGTWQQLCAVTGEPWSCRIATSSLPDGAYSFRALATDAAGNTSVSVATGARAVDNTVASITVDVPAPLIGTVNVGATASSTAGVASVRIQSAPTGTSTWTDLCTDTTSPYACTWNTTAVTDGLYDIRAVMTDALGASTTSPVVSAQRVDNAPLRGVDVQSTNGGSVIGRVESGDSFTFTYSNQVDLTKVVAGWTGASKTVTVRLRDGSLLSKSATDDTLDVMSGATQVSLGSLTLRQDHVKTGRTVQFTATMTAATVTVNGVVRSAVTLRLGTLAAGSNSYLRTVSVAAAMVWSPSAAVTDLQGRPCSAAAITETGTSDRDF